MLTENEFVQTDLKNKEISKRIIVDYMCEACGHHTVIDHENIEDNVDSDPHDPLDDYIVCRYCGAMHNLRKGVAVKELRGQEGLLFADGSFIYVKLGKDVSRLA